MIMEIEERRRARRESFRDAKNPRTPLQEFAKLAVQNSQAKSKIDTATMERLDAVLNACEAMVIPWPLDAKVMADGLLRALLRLLWVKVSGLPLSNPEPSRIAMKLFQEKVVDKHVMRRITAALNKTHNPVVILDCCRGILVMIAMEGTSHVA